MWSLRVLVESVVYQGRRALLQTQKLQGTLAKRPEARHKLSKWQTEGSLGAEAQAECGAGLQCNATSGGGASLFAAGSIGSKFGPATSRLVQSFVRKCSAPLWADARRRATKQVFGETAPYFALVGVTLVSGSQQGLLTKQDELEALCSDIREAINRAGWLHDPSFWRHHESGDVVGDVNTSSSEVEHIFSLADLDLGSVIDKGCNAVVYAARWNNENQQRLQSQLPNESFIAEEVIEVVNEYSSINGAIKVVVEQDATVQDDISVYFNESASSSDSDDNTLAPKHSALNMNVNKILSSGDFGTPNVKKQVKFNVDDRSNRNTRLTSNNERPNINMPAHSLLDLENMPKEQSSLKEYPLAVKMLFNYEAESNAPAILRAMYKELIPARHFQLDQTQSEWQERFIGECNRLPPHPNIVEMPCVFVDRIPYLEGSLQLYPDALPARLNPTGFGRNMSLFCVMRRYHTSLKNYLQTYEVSVRTSLLLFAQLLEAVHHLNCNNIAHRDLKSDNILVSLDEDWQYPSLVLTDFGCCLASKGLSVPFHSREADPRHGNSALMAPEVKTAIPGLLRSVNFSASDLWAVGALAYEIFGLENPFMPTANQSETKRRHLDSSTFKESQLPRMTKTIPSTIRHLVHDLLRRNPKNRPSATVAATLCQLELWGPSKWLSRHSISIPSHTEVMQWLLCLTTKVLCEARLPLHPIEKETSTEEIVRGSSGQLEYELVSTFLSRVHYSDIVLAIKWNRAF